MERANLIRRGSSLSRYLRSAYLLVGILTSSYTFGQVHANCGFVNGPDPESGGGPSPCAFTTPYYPDPSNGYQNMPIMVFKLNFHFFRPVSGGGPYGGDQSSNVAQQITLLNAIYTAFEQPTLPVDPPAPFIEDSRFRFEAHGIYYHDDDAFINVTESWFGNLTPTTLYGVDNGTVLNVFYWTADGVTPAGVFDGRGFVHMMNGSVVGYPDLLAHELGHSVGIAHTFDNQPGACYGDAWVDTYYPDGNTIGAACDPQAPWVGYTSAGAFACEGVGISNNIMGYNYCRSYLSPWQLAIAYKTPLRAQFVNGELIPRGWLQCDPSPLAEEVHVLQSAVWDESKAVIRDLYVEQGATLEVSCTVYMGNQAKIIVEPGARLVINGGKITALDGHCSSFWPGIEVWGTTNQHQFPADHPTYQGLVVLKNGAVIEHAREGIQTMKPGDWTTVGGVVQVQGTNSQVGGTFLNCRRSASFVQYQNANRM